MNDRKFNLYIILIPFVLIVSCSTPDPNDEYNPNSWVNYAKNLDSDEPDWDRQIRDRKVTRFEQSNRVQLSIEDSLSLKIVRFKSPVNLNQKGLLVINYAKLEDSLSITSDSGKKQITRIFNSDLMSKVTFLSRGSSHRVNLSRNTFFSSVSFSKSEEEGLLTLKWGPEGGTFTESYNNVMDSTRPFANEESDSKGYGDYGRFKCASTFLGDLSFSYISFDSSVIFDNSVLKEELRFHEVEFREAPTFYNAILYKGITFYDLASSHWRGSVDLRSCTTVRHAWKTNSHHKARITFDNSIGRDDYSTLDLSKFIIPADKFEIDFGEYTPMNQKVTLMGQIRDRCKAENMIESYNAWDILYQQYNNQNRWGYWGVALNFIYGLWWNFGYSEWMIVAIWMPFFFVLFWIINSFRINRLVSNTYYDCDLGGNFIDLPKSKESLNEYLRKGSNRVRYSFFLTIVIYFGLKIKHEAINYGNGPGMAYIYLVYLLGVFHVAYAVGFLLR